jgi:hypothetical protein
MRAAAVIGIILIVIGIISLAYQGITYTTHKKVLDVGPIHATETQHHTVPLPPVLGGLALVCGVVLLVAGNRSGA